MSADEVLHERGLLCGLHWSADWVSAMPGHESGLTLLQRWFFCEPTDDPASELCKFNTVNPSDYKYTWVSRQYSWNWDLSEKARMEQTILQLCPGTEEWYDSHADIIKFHQDDAGTEIWWVIRTCFHWVKRRPLEFIGLIHISKCFSRFGLQPVIAE